MRQAVRLIAVVFLILSAGIYFRKNILKESEEKPHLQIFASSSFVASWGPGPLIKKLFEKQCNCQVEYYDSSDNTILLQRLKSMSATKGPDVVLGFDQNDLEVARQSVKWIDLSDVIASWHPHMQSYAQLPEFKPYDWSALSFVYRTNKLLRPPAAFEDLLDVVLDGQIALEDPRTSSPGFQFLNWMISEMGEEKAFQFLKELSPQIFSYSTSWSSAYGLFKKSQVLTVFSYTTSPLYHQIEEGDTSVEWARWKSTQPVQVEFVAIPETCRYCSLAKEFVKFLLTPEIQKVVMNKNYMLPAVQGVVEGTPFEKAIPEKVIGQTPLDEATRERLLKKWSTIKKSL